MFVCVCVGGFGSLGWTYRKIRTIFRHTLGWVLYIVMEGSFLLFTLSFDTIRFLLFFPLMFASHRREFCMAMNDFLTSRGRYSFLLSQFASCPAGDTCILSGFNICWFWLKPPQPPYFLFNLLFLAHSAGVRFFLFTLSHSQAGILVYFNYLTSLSWIKG